MAAKSAKLTAAQETPEIDPESLPVEPGTERMEQLLAVGYPDIGTIENAKQIIAEREKNPALYPFEIYQRARAMVAAFTAKSRPISTRPGWRRKP